MIGVVWGTTLSTVVRHIDGRPLKGTTIVQLNGGANARDPGTAHVGSILEGLSAAFDAAVVHFPVPAFFDFVETKEAMWQERSVKHVLEMQHRLDLAIFGVGSFNSSIPSHVYSAGYLDEEDMAQLARDGAVGDVCTVMLREDGTWEDIALNSRATGLAPRDLRRIPKRICVASDPVRAPAVLGALRLGVGDRPGDRRPELHRGPGADVGGSLTSENRWVRGWSARLVWTTMDFHLAEIDVTSDPSAPASRGCGSSDRGEGRIAA